MNSTPKNSRAPLIIAIVVLLLPVLYLVSYLALVVPRGIAEDSYLITTPSSSGFVMKTAHYRWGDHYAEIAYWPLEQIDRRVRPASWNSPWVSSFSSEVIVEEDPPVATTSSADDQP